MRLYGVFMRKPEFADYNYLQNACLEAWAWEYIRRNPEYIQAWKIHYQYMSSMPFACQRIAISEKERLEAAEFGLLFFR